MRILLILSGFILLGIFPLQSQDQEMFQAAEQQLLLRGEVYFRFSPEKTEHLEELGRLISVEKSSFGGNVYTAYANQEGFTKFLQYGLPYEVLISPGLEYKPRMSAFPEIRNHNEWSYYPTYEGYLQIMEQFAQNYPEICTVFSIGQTTQGRELMVARISDNAAVEPGEAQFLYTASIHGDELAGYVLMLHLIDYLLVNYGSNEQVTNLVDNLDIWINPLANPDGAYHGGNHTVFGAKRFNAQNVDINRNFPDPEDGEHPDGNPWQPETEAFMQLAGQNHFVMSANFHGGAEVFNYPWDTWPQLHADDSWWYSLGRDWADSVQFYGPLGYFDDLDNGVTNGYAWYTISGGRQDYMNYFHHCREVTLEISSVKLLPENLLEDFWEYNYRSFLGYMEQCLYGLRGQVTRAGTGETITASLTIEEHDKENSWVVSRPHDGWYFRPVNAGIYDFTFFAPGFEPLVFTGIEVQDRQQTLLNAEMTFTGSGQQENSMVNNFYIQGNPSAGWFQLSWREIIPGNFQLTVTNDLGQEINHQTVNPASQTQGIAIDLIDQPAGVYFLNISAKEGISYTWKLIKQ